MQLYRMANEYLEAFHGLANGEFDEQTITDTLDGLDGEVMAKAANVAAYIMNLEADVEQMKAAEDRIKKQRMAIEKHVSWYRSYLLANMQKVGIGEVKAIDGAFRVRVMAGRESVVIDDPAKLPAECVRTKTIQEPDKIAIKELIASGAEVEGAHIERKPVLKIE